MSKFNFKIAEEPSDDLVISLERDVNGINIMVSKGRNKESIAWLDEETGSLELNDCNPFATFGLPQDEEGFIECNR